MVVISNLFRKATSKAAQDTFYKSAIIDAVTSLIDNNFTSAYDYENYVNHCIRLGLKQKARYSDIDTTKFYGRFICAVDRVKTNKAQVYETRESAEIDQTINKLTETRESIARNSDIDDAETRATLREIDREIKQAIIDRASALALHTRETRESLRVDTYGGYYESLIGENLTQIINSAEYKRASDKVKVYAVIQGGLQAVTNGINKLCNESKRAKDKNKDIINKPIETTASARANKIDERLDTINRLKSIASKQQREIMTLKLSGYENTEIARALNIPKSAVTIQLDRLLKKYKV